jgi:hypothetical protein
MPVVGFLSARTRAASGDLVEALHRGLKESGYVVSQNVQIEYRWPNTGPPHPRPRRGGEAQTRRWNIRQKDLSACRVSDRRTEVFEVYSLLYRKQAS